jgi:hypothetical protein
MYNAHSQLAAPEPIHTELKKVSHSLFGSLGNAVVAGQFLMTPLFYCEYPVISLAR